MCTSEPQTPTRWIFSKSSLGFSPRGWGTSRMITEPGCCKTACRMGEIFLVIGNVDHYLEGPVAFFFNEFIGVQIFFEGEMAGDQGRCFYPSFGDETNGLFVVFLPVHHAPQYVQLMF